MNISQEARTKKGLAIRATLAQPEVKEKMRLATRGRRASPEARAKMSQGRIGAKNHFYGRKHTPETIEKIRISKIGKKRGPEFGAKMSKSQMGEKNHQWRGGCPPYAAGFNRALKAQIRARDGFACFICGIEERGKAHDVHHIDYTKTNHSPGNLVTLCHPCHMRTNNRREAWGCYFGLKGAVNLS